MQQIPPYRGPDPYAPRPGSGLSTAALVLGLVSLIPCVGIVTAPLAIAFAADARRKRVGDGQATAGLVLGIVITSGYVLWMMLLLVGAISEPA